MDFDEVKRIEETECPECVTEFEFLMDGWYHTMIGIQSQLEKNDLRRIEVKEICTRKI